MFKSSVVSAYFRRTKSKRHQHTKIILMLVFCLQSSLWMEVKGKEEEYMSAVGFVHQQPVPKGGQSADLWIPSVLQYFNEHLMPPARMHLILTNLWISIFFFLPGSVKDDIETSENAKETAVNFSNRKYKLHNGETLQDEVVVLNRIVMNNQSLAM